MDPLEEQTQELEVLELIYPDELTRITDDHFTVQLHLDTSSKRSHALILDVTYPPEYPNEVPKMSLLYIEEELESDSDDEKDEETKQTERNINLPEQVLFDKSDTNVILEKLQEEADMQIGIPSVFAIITLMKDEGESLFKKKLDDLEKIRDDELNKQEAELSKKFIGTKVTKQLFEEWRNNFRKEMGIDRKLSDFYAAQHGGKMSGREIFEKGLANDDDLLESFEQIKV